MTVPFSETRYFIQLQLLILRRRFLNPEEKVQKKRSLGVRTKFKRLVRVANIRNQFANHETDEKYNDIMEFGVLMR